MGEEEKWETGNGEELAGRQPPSRRHSKDKQMMLYIEHKRKKLVMEEASKKRREKTSRELELREGVNISRVGDP